jgi:probable HAF family extracellular repeat protein
MAASRHGLRIAGRAGRLSLLAAALCACQGEPTSAPPVEETPTSSGPPTYSVSAPEVLVAVSAQDLQIPEGYGLDINDAGVVVGGRNEGPRTFGFVWTRATGTRDLGDLGGGRYTVALGINGSGLVAGSSTPAGTDLRIAYVRSSTGALQTIGPSATYSFANDINDLGAAVGNITADGRVRAFRWSAQGGMELLNDLGGDFTRAIAINEVGVVAGTSNSRAAYTSQAVRWSATGELTHLPTLGGSYATAQAINDKGQMAGISATAAGKYRAVIWQPDGSIRDIGTLGGPEASAYDINNRGEVVGYTTTAAGEGRAFFWSEASGMLDLGVAPGKMHSGAKRLNEKGQVVGYSDGLVTLWQVANGGS